MAIEVDNLFQALEIVMDKRLENMSYDKTDVCIITDASDAKNGRYWVSPNNGETRYEAYSESEEYKKGESVRVSILNGDYTQKKFIVGKYVVDDAVTPITYVSPLDTVIDVTGNMISEAKASAQYGLKSNGKVTEIPIWSADLALDQSYRDLQASGIYNTISLSAQFKTLLDNYEMRSGSFGLRLDVYTKLNPSSEKYIVRSVYMDSSEMFGNPYAFILYTPQSRKYDLSQLGAVEKLSLWFYQKGDFSYYDNTTRETVLIDYKKLPKDNILIRNIKIGFGSDLSVIQDNTIQAYSTNSPKYRLIVTEADNEKNIGFLWYNKDANNQYLGFSDGIVDIAKNGNDFIYTNKYDKNWNKVTEDVLDENKKPILEFAKDKNGNVILVSVLDKNGNEQQLVGSISGALIALNTEVAQLRDSLLAEYNQEKITVGEYTARLNDISNYETVMTDYLRADYRDAEREALIENEREAELESLRLQFDAGSLTASQYANKVDEVNALYDNKIQEIFDYRIQKTYVLQRKQQDVMVPKVIPYDEFHYMELSEKDARLTAQTGKENVPSDAIGLKLAADLAEIKPMMTKAFDLVTKDLMATLRQMRDRTSSISSITNNLNQLLLTPTKQADGSIKASSRDNILYWYNEADKLRTKMYNVYEQLLTYNYLCQENEKKLEAERAETIAQGEDLAAWNKKDLYAAIKTTFESDLFPMITKFFDDADATITETYSGYRGIYDTYFTKCEKIINQIKEYLTTMEEIAKDNNGNMKKLRPYKNYSYVDYTKQDLSNYDNRYAIYWYRYEPGYTSDDRLYPADWRRLTTAADFGIFGVNDDNSEELQAALEALEDSWNSGTIESEADYKRRQNELREYYAARNELSSIYNYGLPIYDEFIEKDGNYYFSDKVQATNTLAIRMMDGQRKEEKYKVVLFYNHEMYESNEVVFTNLDDVVDPTTADKNGAIVITHGTNSQETYQSYGINNFLVNAADSSKVRQIEVHYEGLLAGDEALADAQVYWYIPNTATMLTCDDRHLVNELLFASDKDIPDAEKPDYSRTGFTCYYKKIGSKEVDIEDDPETEDVVESGKKTVAEENDLTFTYKIKDYYLSTSSRNEIFCKVVKDEYEFETSILFAFTSLGSSGTDYTLAITPATTQIAVSPSSPLTLDIVLYDYKNNTIPIKSKLIDIEDNGASEFKLDWEGPTSYNVPPLEGAEGDIVGAKVSLKGNLPESGNDSLVYGVLKASAVCPITYTTQTDEYNRDAFGDAEENEENANKQSSRNVNLISYYPIPYSAGNYYIEGATSIVYDSMGSNPSYYKDPYKIFTCNTNENLAEKKIIRNGQVTDNFKYDILWRIVYYKKDKDGNVVKLNKETHSDYNICRNYMPTLNEKSGLNVPNMYMENMDCWCSVECWLKDLETSSWDTKYSLIWVQPIFILKNRYPSPMLNSWDGSLTIDKKNGTILSSLVGAGRKTRDNTFEGVLMGDIEGSAGIVNAGNKSGLGIYGFNDGAQSFGFNVDGTGFIGKSGRGRILFDGNEGIIQSASYTANESHPYGMKIDFDDGFIDMRGGIEYTDSDWTNEILDHYADILGAKIFEVEPETSTLVETTKYVIDTNIMKLEAQRALLQKIRKDAQNLTNMYLEGRQIAQKARDAGEITPEAYQEIFDDLVAKEDERKYYAMTTLETAKIGHGFKVKIDDVEKEYEFTAKQYNAILNELDEYILAETYDGLKGKLASYKERYGALSKALQEVDNSGNPQVGHQSHVHLDVKSPYFYVVSEQGKRIINIGDGTQFDSENYPYTLQPDGTIALKEDATAAAKREWAEPDGEKLSSGYYLKSNDFTYTSFNKEDGIGSEQGSGFLLDLTNGRINAFNLNIASKNVFIDSTAEANPFFIVKDNDGCNLIYAGQEDFYIQSHTYSIRHQDELNNTTDHSIAVDEDGKIMYSPGMKFNTNGSDFLFDIKGYYQSVIIISGSEFYLQTDNYCKRGIRDTLGISSIESGHYIYSKPNISLENRTNKVTVAQQVKDLKEEFSDGMTWLQIGTNEWIPDYALKTTTLGTGIKLDLEYGSLDAYDFILRGEPNSKGIAGSYILLDSKTPQLTFHLNLTDSDGTVDLDLLRISPTDFYLHSSNWLETTTKVTTQKTAKTKSGFNIRSGPGTDYGIVGYSSKDKRVPIYEGPVSGEGATDWYRIGEEQWIAGSALSDFEDGKTINKTYGTGMEIDLNDGKIIAYNENNAGRELLINSLHSTYPIQLGDIGNYNFQIGWDGSLRGGSIYDWSIDAGGTATFNRLNANGGSLNWMYIGSATMHSGTITSATIEDATITTGTIAGISFDNGGLTAGDWTLSSSGLSNAEVGSLVLRDDVWAVSYIAAHGEKVTGSTSGHWCSGTINTENNTCSVWVGSTTFESSETFLYYVGYVKRLLEYYGLSGYEGDVVKLGRY